MELIRAQHGLSNQIAIELGIARSAVSRWDQVPHLRAHDIAALTGFKLWQLRPDLWPPPKVKRRRANGK